MPICIARGGLNLDAIDPVIDMTRTARPYGSRSRDFPPRHSPCISLRLDHAHFEEHGAAARRDEAPDRREEPVWVGVAQEAEEKRERRRTASAGPPQESVGHRAGGAFKVHETAKGTQNGRIQRIRDAVPGWVGVGDDVWG